MTRVLQRLLIVSLLAACWLPLHAAPAGAEDRPDQASRLLTLMNQERSSRGLPVVRSQADLAGHAVRHAGAMAVQGRLWHSDPASSAPAGWNRLRENVGRHSNADELHRAFMASESHRSTMLDPGLNYAGVGVHSNGSEMFAAVDFMEHPSDSLAEGPSGSLWLAGGDGGVFALGGVKYHGSLGGTRLNQPIVGLARTPSRNGYWLVASDGGVFSFGDARFFGSTGGLRLNQPIVGMAATPTGKGYWLVASDGGVFSFGDARFRGSTGAIRLNRPIVSIAPTPKGGGYWLVASDGGVFAFGDARFLGSTGGMRLNQPIVAMAPTPSGAGYWLVATDGGVFSFGDARYFGSTGGTPGAPIAEMVATPAGDGYRLVDRTGRVYSFGSAGSGASGALGAAAAIVGAASP